MPDTIRAAQARDRVTRTVAQFIGYAEDAVDHSKTVAQIDDGFDSLDAVELVMELEKEFEIEIDDSDAEKLEKSTVGEIVSYIEGREDAK